MPACYQLLDANNAPQTLARVDDEIRTHFGAPPSTEAWYEEWHNILSLAFALGKTSAEIRETFKDDSILLEILDYLEAHYTVRSWSER
jgi:hypothetical protein